MTMKLLPGQQATPPHKVEGWQGYSLQQLRYRRAYVIARLELEKDQLANDIRTERASLASPIGLMSGIGSAFKYLNWGMLAFQAFKILGPLFHKKKG